MTLPTYICAATGVESDACFFNRRSHPTDISAFVEEESICVKEVVDSKEIYTCIHPST
jgi:hypothetical protein